MTRMSSAARLLHIALPVLGGIMIAFGALSAGYGFWAWVESQAYLAGVTESGQVVEALDASNFVMSSAGLFLLVGILLLGHGGIYLLATRLLSRPRPQHPLTPTASEPARPDVEEDDDLDALLNDIEA